MNHSITRESSRNVKTDLEYEETEESGVKQANKTPLVCKKDKWKWHFTNERHFYPRCQGERLQ
jgi:hypothetical protein